MKRQHEPVPTNWLAYLALCLLAILAVAAVRNVFRVADDLNDHRHAEGYTAVLDLPRGRCVNVSGEWAEIRAAGSLLCQDPSKRVSFRKFMGGTLRADCVCVNGKEEKRV